VSRVVSPAGAPGGSTGDDPAARRAARLLRWYPRAWRARYGDEFTELLIADISERPHATARTFDVVRGGIVARLADAGLCGFPVAIETGRQVRASLVSLGCALAVFLAFGAAMWSQLTIGWEWSAPAGTAAVATVVTSAAILAFLVLGVLAALPVLGTAAKRIARHQAEGLLVPSVVLLIATTAAVSGGRHFENGWPGTGGHHGLVPGGLAAFCWASTLSVSSYWAHPAALAAFPAAELAWMAVSPLAVACAVTGAAVLVRRTELSPGILKFETRLAAAACAVMVVFLAGCCCWVGTGEQGTGGPHSLFHAGLIDVAGVAVLALTLAAGQQAARKARLGLRAAAG
jgi:hypothetical protein